MLIKILAIADIIFFLMMILCIWIDLSTKDCNNEEEYDVFRIIGLIAMLLVLILSITLVLI